MRETAFPSAAAVCSAPAVDHVFSGIESVPGTSLRAGPARAQASLSP